MMSSPAIKDLRHALISWRIWYSLSIQDIKMRYRGSVLGPFWITISTAIHVYALGFLYGALFSIDRDSYLPYFATGLIIWNFISMVVNESTKIFLESKHYIDNINLPCVVYIFRLIFRNIVIFFHNLLVYLSIILLFPIEMNANLLLLAPGLAILCLNGIFYGTTIAVISAKFPDCGAIISSIFQVFFFITPIMWMPSYLPAQFHALLLFNPFVHFVNLLRNPLMGQPFDGSLLYAISMTTIVGLILFLAVVNKYRYRIVFWL